jgi:hypothetical protein
MVCSNSECRFSFCYKCKEEWHAGMSAIDLSGVWRGVALR